MRVGLYEFSDNLSKLSCSGQINFLSRICPEVVRVDIIMFFNSSVDTLDKLDIFLTRNEKEVNKIKILYNGF